MIQENKDLITIGEALGNVIAGYRDRDNARCVAGLVAAVDMVRELENAAYERGVEDAAQIVDSDGKFWRRVGWNAIADKIRKLKGV